MTDHDASQVRIGVDPGLHGHSDGSGYDPQCRDCQIKRAFEQGHIVEVGGPDRSRPEQAALLRPPVMPELTRPRASVQELAGARLFYALYHDAEAVKWLTGRDDRGKATSFVKAYRAATAAFIPQDAAAPTTADCAGAGCPICRQVLDDYRQARNGPADEVRRAAQLVAQGRREAAEAIRQQARMFGVDGKREGEQGTMLSFEVAAQLAEGSTGVHAATS